MNKYPDQDDLFNGGDEEQYYFIRQDFTGLYGYYNFTVTNDLTFECERKDVNCILKII